MTSIERLEQAVKFYEHDGLTKHQAAEQAGVSVGNFDRHMRSTRSKNRYRELCPNSTGDIETVSTAILSRLEAIRDDATFITLAETALFERCSTQAIYDVVTEINKASTTLDKRRQAATFQAGHAGKKKAAPPLTRTQLHKFSDLLFNLAEVDPDELARSIKPDDVHIWERRLHAAAQTCFTIKNKLS